MEEREHAALNLIAEIPIQRSPLEQYCAYFKTPGCLSAWVVEARSNTEARGIINRGLRNPEKHEFSVQLITDETLHSMGFEIDTEYLYMMEFDIAVWSRHEP